MPGVDVLLSRLERVRRTGSGRWSARCPAHADRTPSLSVRETAEGRVLVHCFCGCAVETILAAVGLDFEDLFPPRARADQVGRERRPFVPGDVFEIARREIGVAAVIAADMSRARAIAPADLERLRLAVERLEDLARTAYAA